MRTLLSLDQFVSERVSPVSVVVLELDDLVGESPACATPVIVVLDSVTSAIAAIFESLNQVPAAVCIACVVLCH